MKKLIALPLVAGSFLMASCIGEEPLNIECDIVEVSLHMENPIQYLYHDFDTLQHVSETKDSIAFIIRNYENVSQLPLTLKTTEGAKVFIQNVDGTESPFANGSQVDFSDEMVRQFRTVSQDGVWSRTYKIVVVHDVPSVGNMNFGFEDYELDPTGKFYQWNAEDANAVNVFTDGMWKNGNPGFKLSKSSALPLEYPSTPRVGEGPDGSTCLKLETMNTGSFGVMVNMRIASGSMFNGIFDVSNALKDALKATRFGSPFCHKPHHMKVWLKFERGATYQDRAGKTVPDVLDEPDAYVVYYRNQDENGNQVMLDGNDVLSSPYIVGVGRIPHHLNEDGSDQLSNNPIHGLTNEWQEVYIPVRYTAEVDPEIMANYGYSMVIGFASSWQGAYFKGAVGSKLYIDNISLVCE